LLVNHDARRDFRRCEVRDCFQPQWTNRLHYRLERDCESNDWCEGVGCHSVVDDCLYAVDDYPRVEDECQCVDAHFARLYFHLLRDCHCVGEKDDGCCLVVVRDFQFVVVIVVVLL
jgi:hypothetical protein